MIRCLADTFRKKGRDIMVNRNWVDDEDDETKGNRVDDIQITCLCFDECDETPCDFVKNLLRLMKRSNLDKKTVSCTRNAVSQITWQGI